MTLLFSLIQRCFSPLWQIFQSALRLWTKPDNRSLPLNAALDLNRTKPELILENALLRQQIIILERQSKRPRLSWRDRTIIVLCWPNNTSVLVSAVVEVNSLVAGRAGSGESVGTAAQPSGYHHRPTA